MPGARAAAGADTAGLLGALTANFHRAPHTPVEEAHAFARLMREGGLTRKGVSARLQVSRELVRDRLEILELLDDLHARIDDGTIPLGAIRTLAGLTQIHPKLPACALRRVTAETGESWQRRVTWADVIADPIGAITPQYGFPGWPVEETTAGGKSKTSFLERYQAQAKAHEYLQGAKQPAEIAGRCLALVVTAVLADESCVAQSSRSFVSLSDYTAVSYEVPGATPRGLPWRRQVVELVEDLALERLPEHLTHAIREQA